MIGLLLVSHGEIAEAILNQARLILNDPMGGVVSVQVSARNEAAEKHLEAVLKTLDQGRGVLLMTDLPGATPSNLAVQVASGKACKVISGLNLPMLIRAWNYRHKPMEELAHLALEGGQRAAVELS